MIATSDEDAAELAKTSVETATRGGPTPLSPHHRIQFRQVLPELIKGGRPCLHIQCVASILGAHDERDRFEFPVHSAAGVRYVGSKIDSLYRDEPASRFTEYHTGAQGPHLSIDRSHEFQTPPE